MPSEMLMNAAKSLYNKRRRSEREWETAPYIYQEECIEMARACIEGLINIKYMSNASMTEMAIFHCCIEKILKE